jgi:hypothetical protein
MKLTKELTICLKILQKYSKRIYIVNYAPAMGGMALIRIINADSKFIWSNKLSNVPNTELNGQNPLLYPDSVEGFNIPINASLSHYKNFKKINLATVHTTVPHLFLYRKIEDNEEYMLPLLTYLLQILDKHNGILLIPSHADTSWLENFIPDSIKVVNIIGNKLNRAIIESASSTICKIHLSDRNNFINVDIGNLLNNDYNIYEKEYLKLCSNLELTYKGNSVRAFILLWLEKQKRLLND